MCRTLQLAMIALVSCLATLAASAGIAYFLLRSDEDYVEDRIFPLNFTVFAVLGFSATMYLIMFFRNPQTLEHIALTVLFTIFAAASSYIDLRSKYLYSSLTLCFTFLFLTYVLIFEVQNIKTSLLSALVGFCLYELIYALSKLIYKREAFGKGDVFLMAGMSLLLTPKLSLMACFLSFYYAAIFILIFKLFNKDANLESEIPFAPYICLSVWTALNFGNELILVIEDLLF